MKNPYELVAIAEITHAALSVFYKVNGVKDHDWEKNLGYTVNDNIFTRMVGNCLTNDIQTPNQYFEYHIKHHLTEGYYEDAVILGKRNQENLVEPTPLSDFETRAIILVLAIVNSFKDPDLHVVHPDALT